MTSEQFNSIVQQQMGLCQEILLAKGADYTDGGDRLSNFKLVADLVGVSPKVVWAIYWLKHVVAIANYCGRDHLESEPIDGRIADGINYLLLLAALVSEEAETTASVNQMKLFVQ